MLKKIKIAPLALAALVIALIVFPRETGVILGVFAVLSIIIVIHEFGHFLVAKLGGVWVEEFGLGFPPRLLSKKIGDTLYTLNLIPIGGFVRLHGETLEEGQTAGFPKRSFVNKSALLRIAVALAGIVMNFLLAVVCFTIVYSVIGIQRPKGDIKITDIKPASPAQVAGVLPGDQIVSIAGVEVKNTEEVQKIVAQNLGKRTVFILKRETNGIKEDKKFTITPRENPPENEGAVGIEFSQDVETYFPPLWERPIYGIKNTIQFTAEVLGGFGQVTRDVAQGKSPEGVVGLPGILGILYKLLLAGFIPTINGVGIISLNLAIFNLLPIPPLDGSRVIFVLAEKVFGRKRLPKIESMTHTIGFILLMLLFLAISGREIGKIIEAGSISNFVDGLIN